MIQRFDDGYASDRSRSDGRAAPEDSAYARRIDCCDSPRARERSGGGRGRGGPDPEAYAARSDRPETH